MKELKEVLGQLEGDEGPIAVEFYELPMEDGGIVIYEDSTTVFYSEGRSDWGELTYVKRPDGSLEELNFEKASEDRHASLEFVDIDPKPMPENLIKEYEKITGKRVDSLI